MRHFFSPGAWRGAAEAPFIRRGWTADRIALAYLAGLLPPVVLQVREHGAQLLPVLAISIIAVVVWQLVFGYVRRRPVGLDGLVSGLVLGLAVGPAVPLWQAALAASFGIVLAEQVFGGRGFNFLNPVVVSLAFLVFSFPSLPLGGAAPWLSASAIPAGLFLILTRLISWRQLSATLGALLVASAISGGGFPVAALLHGYGLFLLLFLACDPVGSASTKAGRWAHGALVGGLIWYFAPAGGLGGSPVPFVQAILLGSIFAPLIDSVVVMLNIRRRRARRG